MWACRSFTDEICFVRFCGDHFEHFHIYIGVLCVRIGIMRIDSYVVLCFLSEKLQNYLCFLSKNEVWLFFDGICSGR